MLLSELWENIYNWFDAMLDFMPQLPVGPWMESFVDWLRNAELAQAFFSGIRAGVAWTTNLFDTFFGLIPPILFILILTVLSYLLVRKSGKYGLPILIFFGLLFIESIGYWDNLILTLSLVITATLISVILGVPVGIWMAQSDLMRNIVTPILDFMQTMPAFVYLIPAVAFFSIGIVPGVIASVIFAMPPTVRFTNLGIRQVPSEIIEASDAFGSTTNQKLFKVQLPMAKVTMMAGINQTIMLALSMVVIAAMIGTDGIGRQVYYAVGRNDMAMGFEAGISLVILAIILDRLTQALNPAVRKA